MAPLMTVERAMEQPTVQCVSTGIILKKMKGIKKLKKKIGLAPRLADSPVLSRAPISFHSVLGDNLRASHGHTTIRRAQSFCKGVAFSNRPVAVNEKVHIRLVEIASNWSGVTRFGFIAHDPENLRGCLPKYVCPDLTSRHGCWAKALNERHAVQGSILSFYVNSVGDIIYSIDDNDMGVFLSGVDVRQNLYVVVDVYGNSTSLQFVQPSSLMNNQEAYRRSTALVRTTNGALSNRNSPAQPPNPYPANNSPTDTVEIPGLGSLSLSDPILLQAIRRSNAEATTTLQVYRNVTFQPMSFHTTSGSNIKFCNIERTTVERKLNEYCKGYVFTGQPLKVNEKIVIQVLAVEQHYVGAMAFGVTSANPAHLPSDCLPEDCDELLDRSEYWVVCKDVAASPKQGDELAFTYCENGQITFSKNNGSPHVIMHVDHSLQLYGFFDVFGHTAKIKLHGSIKVPSAGRSMESQHRDLQARLRRANTDSVERNQTNENSELTRRPQRTGLHCYVPPTPSPEQDRPRSNVSDRTARDAPVRCIQSETRNAAPPSVPINAPATVPATVPAPVPANVPQTTSPVKRDYNASNESSECSVCYERQVDSVLYSCGHMCMCYTCALQQWRGRGGGVCPICRAVIKDVIRTYRA